MYTVRCASTEATSALKHSYLSDLLTLLIRLASSTASFTVLLLAAHNSADIVSAVILAMGAAEEMQTAMVNRSIRTIKAVGVLRRDYMGRTDSVTGTRIPLRCIHNQPPDTQRPPTKDSLTDCSSCANQCGSITFSGRCSQSTTSTAYRAYGQLERQWKRHA